MGVMDDCRTHLARAREAAGATRRVPHFDDLDYGLKSACTEKSQQVLQIVRDTLDLMETTTRDTPIYEDRASEESIVPQVDEDRRGATEELTMDSYATAEQTVMTLLTDETPDMKQVAETSVGWGDIAGLDATKAALREAVVLPRCALHQLISNKFKSLYPHFFQGKRKPWTRILLYGPPGTGKTRLAEAVATETQRNFFPISAADVVSCLFGESERMMRQLFTDARKDGPSIVFFDEIDAMARTRSSTEDETVRRIKTELLRQLEGVGSESSTLLFFLASTNCPWDLDKAVLRRFERRIYVPLPDDVTRGEVVKIHLRGIEHSLNDGDFKHIGEVSEGMSGSDLATVVKEAIMAPLREFDAFVQQGEKPVDPPRSITVDDVTTALNRAKSTVTTDDLAMFDAFTQQYGEAGK